MASTFSLSNEFSKEFGNERTSLSDLYFGDVKNRSIDSISNEKIAQALAQRGAAYPFEGYAEEICDLFSKPKE